jgi:hypothetical protein
VDLVRPQSRAERLLARHQTVLAVGERGKELVGTVGLRVHDATDPRRQTM